MKRSRARAESDPGMLARAARRLVERNLLALKFAPPNPAFLDRIEKLAEQLALWGGRMNLTAAPSDPAEIAFHVMDSLMPAVAAERPTAGPLAGAFGPDKRIVDLGSGAGFPALILAAATSASFTLVESRRRRASFLRVAAAEAGIGNAAVQAARVEDLRLAHGFDAATARAFGQAAEVYRAAGMALRTGGLAILYASQSQRLAPEAARAQGFLACDRIAYQVMRAEIGVSRILAVWRKA